MGNTWAKCFIFFFPKHTQYLSKKVFCKNNNLQKNNKKTSLSLYCTKKYVLMKKRIIVRVSEN